MEANRRRNLIYDCIDILGIALVLACCGYLLVSVFGCEASPRGETHQPVFTTERAAPPTRQGYMATWPDGSVSMIEWDRQVKP